MMGLEMMLKSMGIDPTEIKEAVTNLVRTGKVIDARLARMERRQIAIAEKLGVEVEAIPNADEQE